MTPPPGEESAREKKNRSGTSEDKKASKVISCTIKKKRTAKRRRNGRGERLHDFTTINATTIFRAVGAVGVGALPPPHLQKSHSNGSNKGHRQF